MRRIKRALCLLFAVLLLASLAPAPTAAASVVYFTSVNDLLLPLSDDTMPFWSGGTLYVPNTALDGNDLGIHYSRNRDRSTVVLYKMRSAIIFNYATGTVETNSGQSYSGSVIVRGDIVFLPLDVICRFFNLEYSYTRITYGYLVRIKSDSVVLSDATFIDAAGSAMASRYAQYERAHTPPSDDSSGTVSTGRTQDDAQRTVYFVIESTDAARTGQVLSYLPSARAAFLFTPQSLRSADDLLRCLVAGGSAVALRIDAAEGADAALEQIEESNRLLWTAANIKTRLVRLDGASDETVRAITDAGYCPLRFALDFGDSPVPVSRMSARILSAADANGGSCCVLLGADEVAAGTLSALLVNLRTGNCTPARLNEAVVASFR